MNVTIKNIDIPEGGYVDIRVFADGSATTVCNEHPYYRELETEVHDG